MRSLAVISGAISAALACACAIIFHFALESYSGIPAAKAELQALSSRSQAVEQYKQEVVRAKPILARMQQLACRARSMGVSESDWSRYKIDIKESVAFADAGRVIGPAVNSSSYYFKPEFFEIKKSGVVFESPAQQEGMGTEGGMEGMMGMDQGAGMGAQTGGEGAAGTGMDQGAAAGGAPSQETMGGDASTGSGDMALTLKGSFIVKKTKATQ
ncbi:MAG: hypothetical protein V1753_09515 [Pseudomonadota bacterium]